jgi:hypothetical protein
MATDDTDGIPDLPLTARWLGSVGQSERGGVNASAEGVA